MSKPASSTCGWTCMGRCPARRSRHMRAEKGGKTAIAVLAGVGWAAGAAELVSHREPDRCLAHRSHGRQRRYAAPGQYRPCDGAGQQVVCAVSGSRGPTAVQPESRDRWCATATPAKEAAPDPSEMRLVGVMKSGNEPPRALIRFANEQTGRWLAEGEQHNGWRVRKIDTRSVVVEGSGRSHELTITGARPRPTVQRAVPSRTADAPAQRFESRSASSRPSLALSGCQVDRSRQPPVATDEVGLGAVVEGDAAAVRRPSRRKRRRLARRWRSRRRCPSTPRCVDRTRPGTP